MKKIYVVFLIQNVLWSVFAIVTWLSERDGSKSKTILFVIFTYFSYLLARSIGLPKKHTAFTTIISMLFYFVFQGIFWSLLS